MFTTIVIYLLIYNTTSIARLWLEFITTLIVFRVFDFLIRVEYLRPIALASSSYSLLFINLYPKYSSKAVY